MNAETPQVQTMLVLDLLLDVAYHEGTERDLAVAAEAYTLAGYHDAAIMVSHAPDIQERVVRARRGRTKKLLRHDAQGLLHGIRALVSEGVLDGTLASARMNERWQERGGYDVDRLLSDALSAALSARKEHE